MKQVFAEVGSSFQQVGGTCPDGWVVMQSERPTPEHVAQADGSWTLDPSLKLTKNNTAYSAATMALTADYPQLEKDTWPTQNEEASAWVADPAGASTPWIDRAAAERGIEREEYIRRTLIKARQFKVISAFLTGRRQRYEDQIKAGNDPVLDYALTRELLAELQAITETIMSTPAAGLQEALA
jgi:hypothetical protein